MMLSVSNAPMIDVNPIATTDNLANPCPGIAVP